MYQKIVQLTRHSAVYGLGGVATRVIGFLLIPVYTRYLTPADYGILALCTTTVAIVKLLALGGMPSAIFRTYLMTARDDPRQNKVIGTGLAYLAVWSGLLVSILLLTRREVARLLLGSPDQSPYVVLVALAVAAAMLPSMRNVEFRIKDQSTLFSLTTLTLFCVNLGAALYLVVVREQGAWGALLASVLAGSLLALVFVPWALGRLRAGLSPAMLKDMLSFALPLLPGAVAIWVMNFCDIYLLRILRSTDEVGLYNLGYRFGLGIYILTNAFKLAFPKVVFSEAASEASSRLFSRVATYYVAGLGALCTAIAVLAPQIILIADRKFHAAWVIIPLAVFAYFLFGLVSILEVGIDITRKVHLLALIFVLGALVNISGNLVLIPPYGMVAAAGTTLVTYAAVALATYLVHRRLHPMRLEWERIVKVALVLGTLSIAAVLLAPDSTAAALAVKMGVLALYPLGLWAVRFPYPEESRRLRQLLRRSA